LARRAHIGIVRTEAEQAQLVVARAIAGQETAREEIARRAFRIALRTATAALGSRSDAADVAGDVTVDVLTSLQHLRQPASFDAWVHRITVRRTLRGFRRRRDQIAGEFPDDAQMSDELGADAIALRDAIRLALERLPPRQRLAMALRYVHDLKEAEVAAALGCRTGTAAALLSRARQTLRGDPQLADFDPALNGEHQ
jgi:RNA polymerase sigma-70 factor (ECF subfamily)